MLAARAHGLSSLFTTFFFLRREQIRAILGLPPQIFMECAIFLGYGEEKLGKPRRLPVAKVSHANRWGQPYVPDGPARPADEGAS
jgi:nitroreductase